MKFTLQFWLATEHNLAFEFSMKYPNNVVEAIRSFGITRTAARSAVTEVQQQGRVKLDIPDSNDILSIRYENVSAP